MLNLYNYGTIYNSKTKKPTHLQKVLLHGRDATEYRAVFYASDGESVEHFRYDTGIPVFGPQNWSVENFK